MERFLNRQVFISNKNEWFDEGFEVELLLNIESYGAGLFRGLRKGKVNEEIRDYSEFTIMDNNLYIIDDIVEYYEKH